jgi:dGTPase
MNPKGSYDLLLRADRFRITGKAKPAKWPLKEEADSDRARAIFIAPFRRLQNKAQVFSLETNASVRSRLTHSLEVSSIGRFIAQEALNELAADSRYLGLAGKELPFITFIETACLLHDLGNPPFGHFGEFAISDWFSRKAKELIPEIEDPAAFELWTRHFADFLLFDGNPQGFRICTKLQLSSLNDLAGLSGLNLTATTLAAMLKYPWTSDRIETARVGREPAKKAGFFWTENEVAEWIFRLFGLAQNARHPLVYLVEAADDIAYCISDIEDGIEKGIVSSSNFGQFMLNEVKKDPSLLRKRDASVRNIIKMLSHLANPSTGSEIERLVFMQEFRASLTRFLAQEAGKNFKAKHESILLGDSDPLLRRGSGSIVLKALKDFAVSALYSSGIIRNREITADAVLSGLLDAYLPLMQHDRKGFRNLLGEGSRERGRRLKACEGSLISWISRKYLAVYRKEVEHGDIVYKDNEDAMIVMERVSRLRLILDHVSGMTDEFALQSFHLISGVNYALGRS